MRIPQLVDRTFVAILARHRGANVEGVSHKATCEFSGLIVLPCVAIATFALIVVHMTTSWGAPVSSHVDRDAKVAGVVSVVALSVYLDRQFKNCQRHLLFRMRKRVKKSHLFAG